MTKDKHQKRERQLQSANGQGDEVGNRGEQRPGRKSQFKNHNSEGEGAPNEYLDPHTLG